SLIPAKSVGIDDKCGRIKPGFAADFIVLEDNFDLSATYLNGKLVYQA
ncbi:MAG: amidohydrolase family protein, partial [Lactococcus raffinolactis]